tara:strand:- start:111 stop:578 length:468 start_codon:yes stop_codon:yes gene_type:complete
MLKSLEGNFNNPQVHGLLVRHFIELRSVSPKGSTHVLDISGLKDQSIKFWSLWEGYELVGIGALKFLNAIHGEFKSIRVNDKFRNKQNGLKVVNHLVYQAKKLGIEELSLETGAGVFFNPARKLFIKCGFKVCDPFSHYVEDINSVYMSRLISNH